MSKLDTLLQKWCRDGVQYLSIGELEDSGKIKLGRGNVISKKDIQTCPGDYPVYSSATTNNGKIGTYGKYMFEDERISWSIDGGGKFFYRNDEKYSITNVGGWLKVLDDAISTKYLYHALLNEWSKKKFDYIHKAHPSVVRDEYYVPIPPLPVQKEVVRILDSFAEATRALQTKLDEEILIRKKQYEYYRRALIENLLICKSLTLGELATIRTGNKPEQIMGTPTDYEYINAGTTNSGYAKNSNCAGDTVTTPSRGQGGIGFVGYQHTSFWLGPLCYGIQSKNGDIVLNQYLYYYLSCFNEKILAFKKEGGTPAVNASDLAGIVVNIPAVPEQKRIISILDRFDALSNDITTGLPAEIEARQKQYEYYRDKLLSFKGVEA